MVDLESRVKQALDETPPEWTSDDIIVQHVCKDLPEGADIISGDFSDVLLALIHQGEVEVQNSNTGHAQYRLSSPEQ